MQTIYIDISNKGTIPRVFAKQGDVGRSFLAILSDNGIPYAPGDGSVVSVWYSGKSGEGNYTSIGESQAVRYEKNKIFVELITQMLSVAGDGIISLVLNDSSGQQIGFWNIDYTVEPVAGIESPEATQHFTMLSETAAKIMESVDRVEGLAKEFTIDKTLSVDGAAADAAAVGEALSKVIGYGLGDTFGRELKETDLDDVCLTTGWYRVTSFDYVALQEMDECACGLVRVEHVYNEREDEEFVVQTLYLDCQGYMLEVRRMHYNASTAGYAWSEWEYVNPQMVQNVEYRTTQVWEGKPVYRKLANLGSVSNGATVVWHNESNIIPLKYDSHFYAQTVPKYENASAFFFVNVSANQAIISSAGFTARPVSITVDYVYTRG